MSRKRNAKRNNLRLVKNGRNEKEAQEEQLVELPTREVLSLIDGSSMLGGLAPATGGTTAPTAAPGTVDPSSANPLADSPLGKLVPLDTTSTAPADPNAAPLPDSTVGGDLATLAAKQTPPAPAPDPAVPYDPDQSVQAG